MKIYTKTGDNGQTGLWGGQRVNKDSLRVTAYGNVDELNAVLGIIRSFNNNTAIDSSLQHVQNDLFAAGAELATPGDPGDPGDGERFPAAHTQRLEQEIDAMEQHLKPLHSFILPGGTPVAAYAHLARTVCRRAERSVVTLAAHEPINRELLTYLNRLSDWLFVFARVANTNANSQDVLWKASRGGSHHSI